MALSNQKLAYYELGVVGGLHPQGNDELLSITELVLYNKSLIRINGVFGANAPVQNYFEIAEGKYKWEDGASLAGKGNDLQ